MSELASLHATVYGRVQGVFFRAFVAHHARELELKGYVRNLRGGRSVEVRAEGERDRLEELLELLKVGPPAARVDQVEARWSAYTGDLSRFSTEL